MERKLLNQTSHRPWPLPSRPWVTTMRWHDLLFLHWPVRPEIIRPLIPQGLELDTFDGAAWIGVIPFRMTGVRPRYLPPFAGLAFPEMNVRTYVWTPGRSGVWFFSLDATNRLAVRAARAWYGLPYYNARITVQLEPGTVHYRSIRVDKRSAGAEFHASYKPTGEVYRSARKRSTGGSLTVIVFTRWTSRAGWATQTFITCHGLSNPRKWNCVSTR